MERILKFLLLFPLLSLCTSVGIAQNCGSLIEENKMIGNFQQVRSKSQTLIVRGNYSYAIEFMNDKKGILAKIYSKNGVEFNQDDEVIFIYPPIYDFIL